MQTENKNPINNEETFSTHAETNPQDANPKSADRENANSENATNETKLHLMHKFMKVGWLLNRFHEQRRNEFGPMGDPHRGQGRILALLKLQPGISQSDLAYLLGMRPQSAGELLSKLERAGYVTRTPSESDKRVLHVQLTAEGVQAAEQRVQGDGPFATLTAEEKTTLSGLLEKVAAGLEAQVGVAPEGPFGDRGGRGGRGKGGRGWGRGEFAGGPGGRPDPREMLRGMGPGRRGGSWRGADAGSGTGPESGLDSGRDSGRESGPGGQMYFNPRRGRGYGRGRRWAWGWMQAEGGEA